MTYLTGAAADPLKLREPVSTYAPITKVEGLTDKEFPTFPLLGAMSDGCFQGQNGLACGMTTRPTSSSDQLTAGLTNQIHQCMSQIAAAANNVTMLAFSISKKAKELDISSED